MSEETPPARKRYHHGDLRAALLRAGRDELEASGIEGFSLRRVAKRAGVSHAAPAHHFGDTRGLLTALAAEGFRIFLDTQKARETRAAPDPESQLVAAGLGYLDFALANPRLFRLIFASERPQYDDPDLTRHGSEAFDHLVAQMTRLTGRDPATDPAAMVDVLAIWSLVHGLSDLTIANGARTFVAMVGGEDDDDRDAAVAAMLRRYLAGMRAESAADDADDAAAGGPDHAEGAGHRRHDN